MQTRGPAKLPDLSIEWLFARAYDDGNGHLIWKGYSPGGHPKANTGESCGNRPFNVRRAVWRMVSGREPRADCIIKNKCGVENCIEPGCMVQVHGSVKNQGRKHTPKAVENIAKAQRARSHLKDEDIEEIRAAEKTQEELAAEKNISQAMVSRIQLGKNWRDYRAPFAALMMR
jgi:hypothetical protein